MIKDDNILDRVVMSEDSRKEIREECNISSQHFQVIIGKLKKNNIITGNGINSRFIPKLSEDKGSLKLLLNFEFS